MRSGREGGKVVATDTSATFLFAPLIKYSRIGVIRIASVQLTYMPKDERGPKEPWEPERGLCKQAATTYLF